MNKKLDQVQWGRYRIGDLFEGLNGDFDIQRKHINNKGEYVVTAGLTDNGILGRTDVAARIFEENTITIDMFGNAFYRPFKYKLVTHARVFSIKPLFNMSKRVGLFITNSLRFLNKIYGYDNMCLWSKIKDRKIKLPKKDGKIDFEFMEDFVAELKKQSVSRIKEYLKMEGLGNYKLTEKEKEALIKYQYIEWKEYVIGNLFEKLNLRFTKKEFDKLSDVSTIKTREFNIPLVNAKDGNNGIMYYGREKDFETEVMTIDIVSDGAVSTGNVYPQPRRTGVLYNAYLIKSDLVDTEKKIYFLSTAIKKSIKLKFGYENKATWGKVKNEKIRLPVKNGKIDFEYIEVLISAIQKLTIKDLVNYV